LKLSNKLVFLGIGTLTLSAALLTNYQQEIRDAFNQMRTAPAVEKTIAIKSPTPTTASNESNLAIAADPHRELLQTTFNQGVMMLHAKQYELAIPAFHKVIEIAPEMPEAYNNMGYALLGLESYQAAQDFFSSAIELNVNLLSAYFGLALTFAKQENYLLAIGAMETYRHRTTDDDPYLQQAYDHLQAWREAGRG
jgi:tetratricopeptide (TPR) repeat protein